VAGFDVRRAARATMAALVVLGAACRSAGARPSGGAAPLPAAIRPRVIILGFDGFARRYLDSDSAPALHELARGGVTARWMIPSFPTLTFPNFYALATGLYPDHSGIVSNGFVDPKFDSAFVYKDPIARESRWWGGEPIWVTTAKQGVRSATMFWVGSDAEIEGLRPTHWYSYSHTEPFAARVDSLLAWLDLPAGQRPRLLMGYFEEPDGAGHTYGPSAPETQAAVLRVDSALAQLMAGVRARHLEDSVDVLIVSDHGMTDISPERVVYLDDVVDSASVNVVYQSPLLLISARDGNQEALLERLERLGHVRVWKKADVPARLHYGTNERVTPLVAIADIGWTIGWRHAKPFKGKGAHGYDNEEPDMRALFVARGPDFVAGSSIAEFPNVDVYDLLAHLLRITPARNDGTLAPFAPVLK